MEKRHRRLNTLTDIKRMLASVANDFDHDIIDAQKARTLTYVLSILSQVIRDSDLEQRIEKLEALTEKER